ncbi:hypothetical protein [[Limnothrix rosea] IAM M-220]|uniref:hypothetical protein n=1 Tax=[Limnothrix rosea] IAM M-220 TaxID=454133 RepID=UPI000967D4CE|nr:hypothetical protein [[Limnothrix rosea] IAM M-220]OKH19063.1 hypothetical protein NIES208_03595 [[Limnothrix rosea] IAM M-220]
MSLEQLEKLCVICGSKLSRHLPHYGQRKVCGNLECTRQKNLALARSNDRKRRKRQRRQEATQGKGLIPCAVCGERFELIQHTHLRRHDLTMDDYKRLYPDHPLMSNAMLEKRGLGSINQSRYLTYDGKPMDEKFHHFMVGVMLGDGSLEKRPNKKNARYAEGGNNQAYLRWKYNFLRQYLPCTFTEKLSAPHSKSGKRYLGWWIKSGVHPDLTQIHKLFYPNGKKRLNHMYLARYFNAFSLAIWVCDDGYIQADSSRSFLHTQSFSKSETEWLSSLLQIDFKLKSIILFNQKNQPFIRFSRSSTTRLKKIIAQFEIPGMEYKYQ